MIGLSANIEEIKFPVEDVVTQKTHTQFNTNPQLISITEKKKFNAMNMSYVQLRSTMTHKKVTWRREILVFFFPLTSVFIPECGSSSQQPQENKEKGSVAAVNRESQREKTMRQIADCISRAKEGASPFSFCCHNAVRSCLCEKDIHLLMMMFVRTQEW